MIPLLPTATINPHGMVGATFTAEERLEQYAEAVNFYLKSLPGDQSIVFAENSGCIEEIQRRFANEPRIEWFDASQLDEGKRYDQHRGKGYNEVLLLDATVRRSRFIQEHGAFFKVTGRLRVLNLKKLLSECQGMRFVADCKDHHVYELLRMPINGQMGECRYWFSTLDFFTDVIAPRYMELNDSANPPYLAEDLMLDVCRKSRTMPGCKDRFRTQARISGQGGHRLGSGWSFFYSTDNDSFALRLKSVMRQLLRWVMPWWRC